MSLWRYPRTAAALCIAAVLACAAAPAAFLAASDAAYFGRVETVADPYRAPTPTADDYYILRQLAARGQDTTARQTTPQQEQDAASQTPKVYIGASASIESMTWADTAATTAAENALWQLAESSAVPRFWVEQTVGDTVDYGSYTDANGQYYNLNSAYCTTDSLGFVTVRKFAREDDTLFTRYSITMDGRTGMIVEVWFSLPAADAAETPLPGADALRSFAAQAGLESLGDWAAPESSPYDCALYSANGGALITASTHPYTYTGYTAADGAERWYYSLALQIAPQT